MVKLNFSTSLVCQSLLLYMVIRYRCLSAGYIATADHNDFYEIIMMQKLQGVIDITNVCVCGTVHDAKTWFFHLLNKLVSSSAL